MPKSFDELTFSDDWMFQKVLQEPKICAELIERLLHIHVSHVEYPELEKQIEPYYTSKGVRLDVYLKDSDKVIDIEIQSYPMEALGKRIRYYESMLNMDALMKGQDYTELKETYILFICKQDPFKDENDNYSGLPCYTFKNICEENPAVNLHDKSYKVIYNSNAYEKETDEKIKRFLQYINTNEPGEDDFNNQLSAQVARIKENERFRSDYARMNLHDQDIIRIAKREGHSVGLAEGAQQKALEAAENAIKMELTAEQAAKISGLPLEQVLELQKQITVQS